VGDYWDGFYRAGVAPTIPSQFAVFVATEVRDVPRVVDFGCGNGRDTGVLAAIGPTVGVDASADAVAVAQARHPQLEFRVGSAEQVDGEGLLYARFLLHAVPEPVEDALIGRLEGRWTVAFEFRTLQDDGPKMTGDHYRRPVDPDRLTVKLEGAGFTVDYLIAGRGMAKWGRDDAHVCRLLASRR
jgi:SAM-dependent methyltransferase